MDLRSKTLRNETVWIEGVQYRVDETGVILGATAETMAAVADVPGYVQTRDVEDVPTGGRPGVNIPVKFEIVSETAVEAPEAELAPLSPVVQKATPPAPPPEKKKRGGGRWKKE